MKRQRETIDGVMLFDKPPGLSSNDALQRVKRLLNAAKAGHTGTLDPLATGLLPLCFGEATKFSADLLDADKEYVATARLGVTTTTGDAEGEVVETRPVECARADCEAALAGMTGAAMQVPPMHSALKRDGRPLYELARAGIEVERAPREVTIYALELLKHEGDTLVFRASCSKGTYVRTLAEAIGSALGCGAHLIGLRRTAVAHLRLEQAVTQSALDAMSREERLSCLLPVDALLSTLPGVELDAVLRDRFVHGQRLAMACPEGRVRVTDELGTLLGTARGNGFVLSPERLISSSRTT